MRRRIGSVCTFDRLAFVLLFSAVAVAAALSPMQNDTWWQLRAGADTIDLHHVMLTDAYSHTAFGAPWPNHEWLSQVIFYALYAAGGLPLLMIVTAAVIVVAWTLVWQLCAGDVRYRVVSVALFVLPASLHWGPRPHVFSLLFLALSAQLVVADALLWLPLVFLVWANCHGGVVLGLVVVGVMLAAASVDRPATIPRSTAVLIGCAIAMTLTPLGVSFWMEIPRSLVRIRQYPIDEWRRPGMTDLTLAPFWIALAAIVAGVIRYRNVLMTPEWRRTRLLCAGAVALIPPAAGAVRNVGPFLMLAAPALTGIATLAWGESAERRRQERPLVNAVGMAAAAALVCVTVATAYRTRIVHLRWNPLPADSLRALSRCPDNLYNRYDEGGYLIWFAPRHRVFLDGRQDPYSPRLIDEQRRLERSGDFTATFARYEIRCAYLPTSSPVATRLSAAGWQTLYRDRDWVVLSQ